MCACMYLAICVRDKQAYRAVQGLVKRGVAVEAKRNKITATWPGPDGPLLVRFKLFKEKQVCFVRRCV